MHAENADSERFFLVILPKICVDLRPNRKCKVIRHLLEN
jgi:hypothetical protein